MFSFTIRKADRIRSRHRKGVLRGQGKSMQKKGSYISHKFVKKPKTQIRYFRTFTKERKFVQSFQCAYDQNRVVAAKYPVLVAHCFNSSLLIHLTQILEVMFGKPHSKFTWPTDSETSPCFHLLFLYLPWEAWSLMENESLVAVSDFDRNATGKAMPS